MFKLGLNAKGKSLNNASKPAPGKRKPLLGDDEEDVKGKSKVTANEEEIGEFNFDPATASTSKPTKPSKSLKSKLPSGPPTRKVQAKPDDPTRILNSASTRESERKAQEAKELDPSIYDYDAAYDAIHARQAAKKAAEQEDAAQRRPKYMDSLIESAEIRKKDQLRAQDKLLQREREAEGDEFADKEKFVTGAYKAQQEETRKAEEEEKKKQEIEEEKRRKMGMQGFHRQMLLEEEKRHQEAMEAAAELAKKGIKVESLDERERTDADLIKKAQAEGKNIILTDEGQVADKRQLLGAGLNIVAKPKPATTAPAAASRPVVHQNSYQGRNSNAKGLRERQTQMIAEQIEQTQKRAREEEEEERKKIEQTSKSRKTDGEISSAKERYLQRKREAAAAKAAAGNSLNFGTTRNRAVSVPSNCLTPSIGANHFVLKGVKISPCGFKLSINPLNPSASLSFHNVLEHVSQNEILKTGPCPESNLNCLGVPVTVTAEVRTETFVEYAVPVIRLQLLQWQSTYALSLASTIIENFLARRE
ncbi:coiled-coil domain-containing protein 55-domain containing protein [Lophiotrema nucula]|uniref:Coiled-coil domain-containing protein 55-domain containing protein n=1 Tax=Lophiotrema nucula TaxID=690887 RepID=A0A6A5YHV3_9PLEO|nr:coiled-coil domain-containing protein 55-domain containing protein [Lophiotrema nucula]